MDELEADVVFVEDAQAWAVNVESQLHRAKEALHLALQRVGLGLDHFRDSAARKGDVNHLRSETVTLTELKRLR